MSKKHAVNNLPVTRIKKRWSQADKFPQPDGMVVVWIVDKSKGLDHKSYLRYLSEEEQQKAGKFRFPSDRANFILGRSILRILLGQYLGRDPREILFDHGKYGKPALAIPSDLAFNISHSEDLIVLGFGKNGSLGIDVERIKSDIDVRDIAVNYFSKSELRSLASLPDSDQNQAFFRGWTRKESIIKAKGKGLSHSLDSFTVSLNRDEEAILLETVWDPAEREKWKLFSFEPSPGYIAALAVHKNVNSVKYQGWDPTFLEKIG
ncbi:MAG TPA: 4'-phosphopantetheinyl transferase superfamily protein [Eudoraea sp.]|nr:4'-phosphopantetheinyl transferase superfamily protein [Eudoraea sp.]